MTSTNSSWERPEAKCGEQGIRSQTSAGRQRLSRMTLFRKTQQIHLVGIGGAGMSGIAEVLLTMGYKVTGSDLHASETTKRLEELGGKVFIGHQESNVGRRKLWSFLSAVAASNPEVVARRRSRFR